MRYLCPARLAALVGIALLATVPTARSADETDEPARTVPTPRKMVRVELWKVSLTPNADSQLFQAARQPVANGAEIARRIDDLRKQGGVARTLHVMTTSLDESEVSMQIGSREPRITSVQASNRGTGVMKSIQFESVGTLLTTTTSIESNSRVLIQLQLEESYLHPTDTEIFTPEQGDPIMAEMVRLSVFRASIACQPGGAVIAAATDPQDDSGTPATVLYLAAWIVD